MTYQFQEESGSTGIHLELIFHITVSFIGDKGGIEVHVFYNTPEVIFCSSTYISSNAEGKFSFLVRQ